MNTLKLIDSIAQKRSSLFKNVLDYKFNKKRVRVLTPVDDISETSNGVLYWMTREQRVQGTIQVFLKPGLDSFFHFRQLVSFIRPKTCNETKFTVIRVLFTCTEILRCYNSSFSFYVRRAKRS